MLVTLSGFMFRVPGDGEFLVVAWLAGFAGAFLVPGWRGVSLVSASSAIAAALIGSNTGAMWGPGVGVLVLGMVAPVAAHGALSGSLFRRIRRLGGVAGGLRDTGVRLQALGALVFGGLLLTVAVALMRMDA